MKWFKSLSLALLIPVLISGCQSVSTTHSGAVGVDRQQRMFTMLSAQQVDKMAADAYKETLEKARKDKVLNRDTAEVQRLRRISDDLIGQVGAFRSDARNWQWEVNLVEDKQLNAYCMPGGKIMFYSGILKTLKLTDDEVAAIMGHEMAHALREHGRESMSQAFAIQLGKDAVNILLGVDAGNVTEAVVNYGLALPNSRTNEAEADLIGLELMARAGYDPNAAVTLWKKMSTQSGNKVPEFMSTHPSHDTRIAGLRANVAKVEPFYKAARKK